ncbi:MAG: carbon-nitrogen family hydrolase [Candidatus Cohnella colombiensis]|uniref:Carbon-nitrogen family hydrolase n=1 Tax=Candidatus Cohnella colombiensis TaxID=3121368 RepID=A0AA95EZK1_9BACL|nr:MAG: carbon-nitrogen family hydrolase [Cohnella sp.]
MAAPLRIAIIQMNIVAGQPEVNFTNMKRKLEECVKADPKPDLIVLPEMWNTGYALEQIQSIADPDGNETKQFFATFSRQHQVSVLAGSIAQLNESNVTNTAYVFNKQGEEIGNYSKIHLFQLMNEHLHLQAGESLGTFDLQGTQAAVMICYDIRFPELARKLALSGTKILFVPAQWPHPRLHHWRTLLQARAIENQMYVVSCNTVGESGGSSFFGHSMIVDPWGEVIAEAGEEEATLTAQIDLSLVEEVRGRIPVFTDRRPNLY